MAAPIPRSPTMRFNIETDDTGTEWCVSTCDKNGPELMEPEIDRSSKAQEQAMAELAERQNAWINEYRAKMFRNVVNPRIKLKTEQK